MRDDSAKETDIAAAGNLLANWEHVKLDGSCSTLDLDASKIQTLLSTALSNATVGKIGETAYLPPDADPRCRDFLDSRPARYSKPRDAKQSLASNRVASVEGRLEDEPTSKRPRTWLPGSGHSACRRPWAGVGEGYRAYRGATPSYHPAFGWAWETD